jgi:hypothetical protein
VEGKKTQSLSPPKSSATGLKNGEVVRSDAKLSIVPAAILSVWRLETRQLNSWMYFRFNKYNKAINNRTYNKI